MVTVDLADVLTFESGANVLPPDDLVSRALRAAGRDALVTVDKRMYAVRGGKLMYAQEMAAVGMKELHPHLSAALDLVSAVG